MCKIVLVLITIIISMNTSSQQLVLKKGKDNLHENNVQIFNQKKTVLESISLFNDWFMTTNNFIRYQKRKNRWRYSEGIYELTNMITDEERKSYVSDKMLPQIKKCSLITPLFKAKILSNHANLDDPGNLAFLMTRNPKGKEVMNLLIADLDGFYVYLGLSSLLYSDEPGYEPELPKIEEKDKINYYCEMISIKENQATFVLDRGAVHSNPPRSYGDYIVISLIKSKEGKWLVNNLQILDEGEQIVNE